MEQEQRQQLEETLNTMQEQARLTAENREVSRHDQRCGLCAVQVLMNFCSLCACLNMFALFQYLSILKSNKVSLQMFKLQCRGMK